VTQRREASDDVGRGGCATTGSRQPTAPAGIPCRKAHRVWRSRVGPDQPRQDRQARDKCLDTTEYDFRRACRQPPTNSPACAGQGYFQMWTASRSVRGSLRTSLRRRNPRHSERAGRYAQQVTPSASTIADHQAIAFHWRRWNEIEADHAHDAKQPGLRLRRKGNDVAARMANVPGERVC